MPRERRKNFRVEWNSPAMIYNHNGRAARPCVVSNLSNGGAKIVGVRPETIPDEFLLRVSPHSRARRCRVLWRSRDALGVEFVEPREGAARSTAAVAAQAHY
jgi:PilZ domain-containing protein